MNRHTDATHQRQRLRATRDWTSAHFDLWQRAGLAGWWVVTTECRVVDFFASYHDALVAGDRACPDGEFVVRQVPESRS